LIQKTIHRTIEKEKKLHEKKTRDRVETIAKIISMSFDKNDANDLLKHDKNNNNNKLGDSSDKNKVHTFKLNINDYPTNARKSVTYKPTLAPLKENYDVRITQKGTFVANGRKPQKGESPLYLEIQGTNINNIHGAIKELQQILHSESQKAANYGMKYGKYKVV